MKGHEQSMCLKSQCNPATETINLDGGEAFAKTPKLELVSMLLTGRRKNEFNLNADVSVDCGGVVTPVRDEAKDWEQLIKSGRLGYLALLRNLRTILTSVPHLINEVVDRLTDERLTRRSRVRPSCFLPAVQALEKDPPYGALRVLAALSDAVDLSQAHEPRVSGSRPLLRMDSGKQVLVGSITLV
ncbi:MAG: hypothetical protein JWO89_3870 [Verrucomicrobiaceae bacterium]|nr:hypothetical protein [Verrucomicrobiaceae bacterium]